MFGVYSIVFGFFVITKSEDETPGGALAAKARCPVLPPEAFRGIFLCQVRETEVLGGLLQV